MHLSAGIFQIGTRHASRSCASASHLPCCSWNKTAVSLPSTPSHAFAIMNPVFCLEVPLFVRHVQARNRLCRDRLNPSLPSGTVGRLGDTLVIFFPALCQHSLEMAVNAPLQYTDTVNLRTLPLGSRGRLEAVHMSTTAIHEHYHIDRPEDMRSIG